MELLAVISDLQEQVVCFEMMMVIGSGGLLKMWAQLPQLLQLWGIKTGLEFAWALNFCWISAEVH